jgi:REP element-mobilizing transposase RayT
MSESYKVLDSSQPNFITLTITDWVDLFIRPEYCKILDQTLKYYIENKGIKIHAYVYMTSHIHIIVSSTGMDIPDFVRGFKSYTTKEFLEVIDNPIESRKEWLLAKFSYAANRITRGGNYKIWKDGFHPVLLDLPSKIVQRVEYIHANPVDAQIVHHERDYVNSSYRIYEDSKERLYFKIHPLY